MESHAELLKGILRALDWGEGTVSVIGHKSPDADSVFSAMAYAELMHELGFKCQPYMAGEANQETRFAANYFKIQLPPVIGHINEGDRVILVDHSEYSQAVEGIRNARILQVIDHHGVGDIIEANRLWYQSMPVGSTCTVIFLAYLESGISITPNQAVIMLSGIISDTRNLTKSHTSADVCACNMLSSIAGLDQCDISLFAELMKKASQSHDGMSDREIFLSDFKDYVIGSHKIGIASIDCTRTEMEDGFIDRMYDAMIAEFQAKSDDMIFAKIDEDGVGTTILFCGEGARAIAEEIFGPSENGRSLHTNQRVNRKSMLLPAISAILRTDSLN